MHKFSSRSSAKCQVYSTHLASHLENHRREIGRMSRMRAVRCILLAIILTTLAIWGLGQFWMLCYVGRYAACWIDKSGIYLVWNSEILPLYNTIAHGLRAYEYPPAGYGYIVPRSESEDLGFPFGFILLVTIPPWFIRHRRTRELRTRSRLGACLACGYDSTGNESGVCSECGESRGEGNDGLPGKPG